jgi:DNA-directed RNA polymerase specialized sigma24 family protein
MPPATCRMAVAVGVTRARYGAAGDATAAAVEAAYRSRHEDYLRVATAIAGSQDLGRDAVQEGLARALARRRSFRGSGSVEAWLWRIVVNAARNARRDKPLVAEPDAETAIDDALDPDVLIVRRRIAQLPERQYATIARVIGVRKGTVSATLNQAHTAVRRLLEEVPR